MFAIAATDFVRNFGTYREEAQRAPVQVIAHKRVAGYFLSATDFAEYQQLKALKSRALAVEDLDSETVQALCEVRMDPRHDHLNDLLD